MLKLDPLAVNSGLRTKRQLLLAFNHTVRIKHSQTQLTLLQHALASEIGKDVHVVVGVHSEVVYVDQKVSLVRVVVKASNDN